MLLLVGMLSVNHYDVKTHLSLFKMPMKSESVNKVWGSVRVTIIGERYGNIEIIVYLKVAK